MVFFKESDVTFSAVAFGKRFIFSFSERGRPVHRPGYLLAFNQIRKENLRFEDCPVASDICRGPSGTTSPLLFEYITSILSLKFLFSKP